MKDPFQKDITNAILENKKIREWVGLGFNSKQAKNIVSAFDEYKKEVNKNMHCSFCGNQARLYPVVVDEDENKELWCEGCIENSGTARG